jgi:hypothetical protein
VDDNGAIAQTINKSNDIIHAQENAVGQIETKAEQAASSALHDLGGAITKPFRDIRDWWDNLQKSIRDQVGDAAAEFLKWLEIGGIVVVVLSIARISWAVASRISHWLRPHRNISSAE